MRSLTPEVKGGRQQDQEAVSLVNEVLLVCSVPVRANPVLPPAVLVPRRLPLSINKARDKPRSEAIVDIHNGYV
jgi:hypothetical protein